MTVRDQTRSQAVPTARLPEKRRRLRPRPQPGNVGQGERAVSLAAGSILAMLGIGRRSIPGMLVAGAAGVLLYRGVTGYSYTYNKLGIDTARPPQDEIAERGIHVEQAFLINKPPEELYRFWRNFANLPRIMAHLHKIEVLDDRRSHWVVTAPRIAGKTVQWDAEITRDEPNALIAWRSLPGADVDNTGQIRFVPAKGDRGTEVHVFVNYLPPAGRLGDWVAKVFGKSPQLQMREDLRNFKRFMETGEIPTIIGQPHGTCTGVGEIYTE
ncbi:MAG TPA: SRPBCC family protein [Tepidisphaeraceae bacterium]|nr:SRPBCC family protein [Tepidisphaeraceae bacterium]